VWGERGRAEEDYLPSHPVIDCGPPSGIGAISASSMGEVQVFSLYPVCILK
jgi:hypothetical protein